MRKLAIFISWCVLICGAGVEEFVEDFHFTGFNNKGERIYDVWAKTARILEDIVKMDKLTAKVYGEDSTFIESQKATLFKKTQNIVLKDDVKIYNSQGQVLETQELQWEPKKNQASTDKEVVIKNKKLLLKAKGLKQDMNNRSLTLDKDIKLKFEKKNKTFTYITCDGPMEIDYEHNCAVLYNNVKVDDERGQIFADRMDVFFDPNTKSINKIHAKGNVKILRKDSTTYAQEAVYDITTKKLTLSGSPRILIISEKGLELK